MHAAAPSPPPVELPRHVRREGRLWIGRFLVPEEPFMLACPCPACGGPAFHDDGDLKCLWCGREVVVAQLSERGRVEALDLCNPREPALVRIGAGQTRRTARAISKTEGATGLQARVLRQVPTGPEAYAVVEHISRILALRREQVKGALERLETQGLVERFTFNAGYRVGYRRPTHPRMAAPRMPPPRMPPPRMLLEAR